MATLEQIEDGEVVDLGSDMHSMPTVEQIHPDIDSGSKGYKDQRRRRIIYAISATLVLLVIGLAIALGISAIKDSKSSNLYDEVSASHQNASGGVRESPRDKYNASEFGNSHNTLNDQSTTEVTQSGSVDVTQTDAPPATISTVAPPVTLSADATHTTISTDAPPTTVSTDAPPPTNSTEVLAVSRFGATVDFISREGVSEKSELETAGTPANQAALWIANEDLLVLPVPGETESEAETSNKEKFLTRYILALLYFATGGAQWQNRLNFLSEKPSCEWYEIINSLPVGVGCDPASGTLAALFLTNNNIQNELPAELGRLTSLIMVDFEVNFITGTLPDSLQSLTNLEHLHIGSTGLEGTLPSWIGFLTALKSIDVAYTKMNGPIPVELTELEMLHTIALDHNAFTGDMASIFGPSTTGLRNLTQLYLDGNGFSGVLDEEFLSFASQLQQLDISDNKLKGEIPRHIFNFSKLEVLDLHDNVFTSLPEAFESSAPLKLLALQKNKLAGPIPLNLFSFAKLTHLDLSQNQLTGEISEVLGEKLQGLTYLFLAENNFEPGPIPFTVTTLFDLQEISLKSTHRTGPIPEMFGLMTNLVFLDLDDNSFTGQIPKSLGSISTLQLLLLNRNQLTGSIPEELARLSTLDVLFLEGNSLTGGLEPICNNVAGKAKVVAQCSLCGNVTDTGCCTECCQQGEACNEDIYVADMDPSWEMGYERAFGYTLDKEDWYST